jgi:hypothetical protein
LGLYSWKNVFVTFFYKVCDKVSRIENTVMKAIDKIKEHLKEIPEGESFTTSSLRHLASVDNVRQILNRLIKNGEIKRIARGVFVKAKPLSRVGESRGFDLKKLKERITGERKRNKIRRRLERIKTLHIVDKLD